MAIIFCSQCGKKVTDRMTVCPHCQAVLIKKVQPEPVTKEAIKESLKVDLKGELGGIGIALGITLLTAFIWSFFAIIVMGRYIGNEAAVAVGYARQAFFSKGLLLLVIEALILCALSIFCKKNAILHFAFTTVIALLCALILRAFLPVLLLKNGVVEADKLAYTMMAAPGFAFAFPALLGALTLAGIGRPLKTGIILQAGLCATFLVLSVVLCLLTIVLFGMGTGGLAIGNLITAIIVLLLAALLSNGFRQLITPKQLA